jgi:GNAT superfamily N-acetyltransferase
VKGDVPRDVAVQIVSYVRMQWPFLLERRTPMWESTPYPPDGVHFVITDGDALVSHALAHVRTVEHAGERYVTGALSSVFTYPAYRKLGHGARVVAAATEHIRASGADLAMLFTGAPRRDFYARLGWEPIDGAQILSGDPPQREEGLTMMLFLSDKGRRARGIFEREPVHVGPYTW